MTEHKKKEAPSSRRPRAPTITIDTSHVPDMHRDVPPVFTQSPTLMVSDDVSQSPVTADMLAGAGGSSSSGRPHLPSSSSFESRDSQPTSPHNVSLSSPVRTHGFLAVPDTHRSRQNSVDSDDGSRSIATSQGETMVGSVSMNSMGGNAASNHAHSLSVDVTNEHIIHDPNALKPDQGKEADFEVEDNPFAFAPGQLNKMFEPKSLSAFWALGGLAGIEKGLQSDRRAGLSVDETKVGARVSFAEATSAAADDVEGKKTDAPSTPSHHGHDDAPFSDRMRVFSDNRLPEKKAKSLLQLVWITFNDKILIMLSIAAAVSLAVGLYQTFGQKHSADEPAVEWIEGVAIIVAILIVVIVGSLNDWQKERQFAKLNRKKTDRMVKVVRSGRMQEISIFDVLVGDVMQLETGDMIPVDGVLIEGHNVKCDESQATGESDLIRKRDADEVYAAIARNDGHESLRKMDPFIQSGARVMEGLGTFMVTATGVHSTYGKTMMSLQDDPEITPLQMKLNVIADYIAKLGGAAALLLFVVLFIEFLVRLPKLGPEVTSAEKGQDFINIFIVVITIIVVAVPEGLPLAVTLALSYATTKMVRENNLVRQLKACEVMGNATTICSDKTGTLTQNRMRVVAGSIGTVHRFGEDADEPAGDKETEAKAKVSPQSMLHDGAREPTPRELVNTLSKDVRALLMQSIVVNSTAFEGEVAAEPEAVAAKKPWWKLGKAKQTTTTAAIQEKPKLEFVGSKTESALLTFAREHLSMGPLAEERANAARTLQLIPFDSGRKCMGVVVELPGGRGARLLVKGASEIVLRHCTQMLRDPTQDTTTAPLTEENQTMLGAMIEQYAGHSLRTIGLVSRDFAQWPPAEARRGRNGGSDSEVSFSDIFHDMTFVGLVGIKDPLRAGVREAVKDCQHAGVIVRMVTGDNRLTAQAIALDCGILQKGDPAQTGEVVLEGPTFRNMQREEQVAMIPRLRVLARSSPEDKRVLVQRLKELGETVAVTGDGTNDAPALKLADVGFSMGISGTEVAKEASAIILMDDNFASIVKALRWGRAVNDAVKRFLQFQLTVNVTAVLLTFVSAVSSSDESSVLTAVQLLWVNLIMDTLAALALATDPPHPTVLDRKPERKGSSIISTTMWKMIIGQAAYQLAITFMLYFGGKKILPSSDQDADDDQVQTLVFNTFVWMQVFNQWNNRRLDNHFNIFEGITQNYFFLAISLIMMGGQVLIIMVGGVAFNIADAGQSGVMWGYAIAFGFISIPIGMAIRLVPDSLVERLVPNYVKRIFESKTARVDQEIDALEYDERFSNYPAPLTEIRDELAWLRRIKGGRLNNLKYAMKHPRQTLAILPRSRTPSVAHSRSNSQADVPTTAGGASVAPGTADVAAAAVSVSEPPHTPSRENSFGSIHGHRRGNSNSGNTAGTPSPSHSRQRSRSMRSRSNSALGAPSVMAGIIAGSVAVGWSPVDRTGGRLPLSREPSTASAAPPSVPEAAAESSPETTPATATTESSAQPLVPGPAATAEPKNTV